MYIKDRIKTIFHYFLLKIIRNIKFPPATAHFAPPPTTPQCYYPNSLRCIATFNTNRYLPHNNTTIRCTSFSPHRISVLKSVTVWALMSTVLCVTCGLVNKILRDKPQETAALCVGR